VDIMAVILPISFAISLAFVYHRFIESNQLIAMQSCGISPIKLLHPMLMMALPITCYLYISNAYLSPKAWSNFREMEFQIKNNIDPPEAPGTIFSSSGFSVYAQEYIGNFFFRNIFIVDSRSKNKSCSYFSRSGSIRKNMLTLTDGERIEVDVASKKSSVTRFKSYQYDLKEILNNIKRPAQPNEKFMHELLLEDSGSDQVNTSLRALFHQKITSPLLTIVFSLMSFFMIALAPYRRKTKYIRMTMLIAMIIVFQGTYFWIANAAAKNLKFVDFNYILISISIVALTMLIFIKNRRL
jgi:lipopolysaccharide export system permease protein